MPGTSPSPSGLDFRRGLCARGWGQCRAGRAFSGTPLPQPSCPDATPRCSPAPQCARTAADIVGMTPKRATRSARSARIWSPELTGNRARYSVCRASASPEDKRSQRRPGQACNEPATRPRFRPGSRTVRVDTRGPADPRPGRKQTALAIDTERTAPVHAEKPLQKRNVHKSARQVRGDSGGRRQSRSWARRPCRNSKPDSSGLVPGMTEGGRDAGARRSNGRL